MGTGERMSIGRGTYSQQQARHAFGETARGGNRVPSMPIITRECSLEYTAGTCNFSELRVASRQNTLDRGRERFSVRRKDEE